MPLAGHAVIIEASSDDATYNAFDGLNDASFSPSRDLLDTTAFNDASARQRLAGLTDGSISLSGDYESADTAQALVRTSFTSGAAIYIQCKWDGTNGHKATCIVEDFEISASVDGKVEWSATIQFNSALTVV